jgi:hypothetical protein
VESLFSKDSRALPARLSDRQVSSEEKESEAISRRLLHKVKVAVRTAKQDARSVPIKFGPSAVPEAY